ncbi:MAG TPA: M24 family metallopeptidase [Planctomycetota bacterium]|jgi:Xaa-Pro aminopeptidase
MSKKANDSRQAEFDVKLSRIRAVLSEKNLSGVVLSSQALFSWATAGGDNHVVTAGDQGVASLLVTPQTVTVMATNIEIERLRTEEFKGIDIANVEFWSFPWHGAGSVSSEVQRRLGSQPWASDSGLGTAGADDFVPLTYALTESEIARYRKIGKDCAVAMEEALAKVKPGFTEFQVASLVSARLLDRAVRPHVLLVASDERVLQFRHPIPKEKKVRKHLMAVLCGKRGGLIINLTRMVHFGKLPAEIRRRHDAVCAVDMALNTATIPGRPIGDVFAAGLAEYAKQGFADEWKLHHQGGPTGYQGRSFLGKEGEARVVEQNQAFAWNPSITGTKSEDTILATSDGIEFLSAPTRDWPALSVKSGGKTWRRADIWVR